MRTNILQIGTDVYECGTQAQIMETIKSVVIYHQGQLDSMSMSNDLAKHSRRLHDYLCMEATSTESGEDLEESCALIYLQCEEISEQEANVNLGYEVLCQHDKEECDSFTANAVSERKFGGNTDQQVIQAVQAWLLANDRD